MSLLYNIFDKEEIQIGTVRIDSDRLLVIDTLSVNYYESIEEVLIYIEKNQFILIDLEGNIYSLEKHMKVIKGIDKMGIGYLIK